MEEPSAVKENVVYIFANFIVCSYIINVVQNKICSVIRSGNVSNLLPFSLPFIKFLEITHEILVLLIRNSKTKSIQYFMMQ